MSKSILSLMTGLILVLLLVSPVAAQDAEVWTEDEVMAGSGAEQCAPLAELPKEFSQPWKLGFINPNRAHSFWGTVSAGMQAAADFYGVEFVEMYSARGQDVELCETRLLNQPNVIGTHNAL